MKSERKRALGILSVDKLKKAFLSKKGIGIIIVIAVAVLLLFTFSDSGDKESVSSQTDNIDTVQYTASLESKLENIISSISGVGKTKIMITIKGGPEYTYQTDTNEEIESDENFDTGQKFEKSTVILKSSSGSESPILKSSSLPEVTGVAVVCEGGAKSEIKENIKNAVKALLGISTNRICILKMN